jgi:Protein of unknown function (DUF1566)
MRKTSLTVIAAFATLLWAGAAQAWHRPRPLTCSQRQTLAVDGLTDLLNRGQKVCAADLNRHGCDASVCSDVCSSAQAFPATGQTTPYAVGDDGDIKAGSPLNYTDNHDGTITDNNTGLMWEKKDEAGGLDDVSHRYPWSGRCSVTTSQSCGTDADCPTSETCQAGDLQNSFPNGMTIFQWVAALNTAAFAGHADWRIPNVKEVHSIADYGTYNPAVDAAFNTNCSPTCTVDGAGGTTECSCTQSDGYWSATTYTFSPSIAWFVYFYTGAPGANLKNIPYYVRAVRSGL